MAFVNSVVAAVARRPTAPSQRARVSSKRRRALPVSPTPTPTPTQAQAPLFSPLPALSAPRKRRAREAAPADAPAATPVRRRKPHGYWNDLCNVQRELEQVVAQLGYSPRCMPRIAVLQRLGRGDLLAALAKHGGVRRVAALLRWSRPMGGAVPARVAVRGALSPRRAPHFWADDVALAHEFRRVARLCGCEGCMPTRRALLQMKRSDLVNAAAKRGGLSAFALQARLKARTPARGSGYWQRFEHVATHVRAFSELYCEGRMPTAAELCERGMSSLSNAVAFHGGFHEVATRLQLTKRSAGRGAPTRWTQQRLVREIELFVGTCMPRLRKEGVLPKESQLRRFGRNDLSYAIAKFGGFAKVAELCGMKQNVSGPFRRVNGKVVSEGATGRGNKRKDK